MKHDRPCDACGSMFEEQRLTLINLMPAAPHLGVNMLMCGFCAMDHRNFMSQGTVDAHSDHRHHETPDAQPVKPPCNRHPYNRALNKPQKDN